MTHLCISSQTFEKALFYLNIERNSPTLRYLNRLIGSYVNLVPWESATRIVKRRQTEALVECPRWPEEFWLSAIETGSGGTCFETNYAFFALLTFLGFEGYMTINDMGETRNCHAAVIIVVKDIQYLVDVSLPLEKAMRLNPTNATRFRSNMHSIVVKPVSDHRYRVTRVNHPQPYIFTLLDSPVTLEEYETAVMRDYDLGGYFLDRLVISKAVDGRIWRFNSADLPYKIESFSKHGRNSFPLSRNGMCQTLSTHFGISLMIIQAAVKNVMNDAGQQADAHTSVQMLSCVRPRPWLSM